MAARSRGRRRRARGPRAGTAGWGGVAERVEPAAGRRVRRDRGPQPAFGDDDRRLEAHGRASGERRRRGRARRGRRSGRRAAGPRALRRATAPPRPTCQRVETVSPAARTPSHAVSGSCDRRCATRAAARCAAAAPAARGRCGERRDVGDRGGSGEREPLGHGALAGLRRCPRTTVRLMRARRPRARARRRAATRRRPTAARRGGSRRCRAAPVAEVRAVLDRVAERLAPPRRAPSAPANPPRPARRWGLAVVAPPGPRRRACVGAGRPARRPRWPRPSAVRRAS